MWSTVSRSRQGSIRLAWRGIFSRESRGKNEHVSIFDPRRGKSEIVTNSIAISSFSSAREQGKRFFCRTFVTSSCMEAQARWTNPQTGEYVGLNLNENEKKRRAIENAKLLRERGAFRQHNMTPEAKLMWRLELTRRKLALQKQRLESLKLPPDEESEHDPEILTPEQLYSLKKLANMNRNYVPVGVRGIFGGTIENIHQHWKFHETCQIDLHMFHKSKIKDMAAELARLSGGIVVDIIGTTVYMYRGRNYRQPNELIPENQLSKRNALYRARYNQSKEALEAHMSRLAARLEKMRQESDVAGLVEKIAFVAPPLKHKKREPPRPKSNPAEYQDFTEDEFGGKDDKTDTDDNLVGGVVSSDEFESDGEFP
ncbi:uncharacterized CRM domain-containing protein At3g25440, chloroplastic-like [Selaginella moellendorffii]|uniref:uncharacterized CRM domain-containing protein At3g25440, chloroplastic-like n=1 Tax=Selaginella moellendorffii TaxID=88036 RepID=UPI000D1C8BCC|nr:uncharacterized CRM domain-containing protein At3g25440, chloroplastic-like [Selaginella moellendorffii]|eukprot:XP_024533527.1 uncharacterized CRM domain-containing protein At3g25440, chloroplastic-like [Selaginella moellendorffii]